MTVELNKEDLITLVKGLDAPNELMKKYKKLGIGSYTGGFVDEWRWDKYGLKELSEEELYNIFQECRSYWNKKLNT